MTPPLISVIIPSNLADRFDSLCATLRFLYGNGFDGEILVGVWGGHERSHEVSAAFPSVRIVHQHGTDLFTTRALDLAQGSTGAHIIQIGDDDFLVPSALRKMVAELRNPSVFAVQGTTLSIYHGGYNRVLPFPQWPADEHETLPRYLNYLSHTGQMFHAMLRRHDFIEKLRYMDDAMRVTRNHVWFEIIGEFYILIKGRFCMIEDIFILRGKHSKNTSRELLVDVPDQMFPYHLLSNEFTTHYKFFEAQVFQLFESVGVDVTANRRAILDGIIKCFGSVIYGLRGPVSPREAAFREGLAQNPEVANLVRMVANAQV